MITCFSNAPEIHAYNANYISQIQFIRSNALIFKLSFLLVLFSLCFIFIKTNNLFHKIRYSFFIGIIRRSLLFKMQSLNNTTVFKYYKLMINCNYF